MKYSIQEVAAKFGLTAHTLRYYDKEGLLPFIGREPSGNRIFMEKDLDWLAMICCLKDTGMPIKEIKQYADWCAKGMETLEERKAMLADHRLQVLKQMDALQQNLDLIDSKIAVYNDPVLAEQRYGNFSETK
ncbi:HTH-type transcriptional regulator AdhR [compost metagenome]|uniref:MerR family transcriptional regulator n=1 Tax=Paenibacillus rhizolycopersici TaxID=2780073 RepID=A0ABS2H9U5_9BACL|nr:MULTISPECIES: MerR family transcriptional regulator [Paenibacillus]MBM6996278.1 MerR family transcriptional regulator [Paenibacillus rhizolycopersici]MUG86281.1 MerR family transcriptional regulator [Paenibacillus timonensis]